MPRRHWQHTAHETNHGPLLPPPAGAKIVLGGGCAEGGRPRLLLGRRRLATAPNRRRAGESCGQGHRFAKQGGRSSGARCLLGEARRRGDGLGLLLRGGAKRKGGSELRQLLLLLGVGKRGGWSHRLLPKRSNAGRWLSRLQRGAERRGLRLRLLAIDKERLGLCGGCLLARSAQCELCESLHGCNSLLSTLNTLVQ